jgi:hypothetical protein
MRELKLRLRSTTLRERLLLGGLVLSALIYLPLLVFDWKTIQSNRYIEASEALSAAKIQQSSLLGISASASDLAIIEDMDSWGFKASNVSVAQVLVERRLLESANTAGLRNVIVSTSDEIEVVESTQWLRAEIQTDLLWTPTFGFLDELASWPEGFRIVQFSYQALAMPGQQVRGPDQAGRVIIGIAVPVSLSGTGL